MKAAIIIERANIELGGAEKSIYELAAALALRNIDVKILAATGQSQSHRVEVLCPDAGKRAGIRAFEQALSEHFKNNQYDIIHSTLPFDFADIYQPRGGSYAEAAVRNAASFNCRCIQKLKILTSFVNFKRTAFARRERKLCKKENTTLVACLSEYVREQFKRHYNLADERLRVISNGVKLFKEADKTKIDNLRAEILFKFNLKEADEPVFFLFAANNFRLKGLRPLIKAMAIVKRKNPGRPAYLIIAGRGPVARYKAAAARNGVKDRVLFLGQTANIQNLLMIADAAVLPTYYDPASRFILEALGAGKPVITTKFNGAADLFTAERHGKILNSPDDINALADSIAYYCQSQNINTAKTAIEEDDLKSKVSINTHCEKLISLYEEIIKNKVRK